MYANISNVLNELNLWQDDLFLFNDLGNDKNQSFDFILEIPCSVWFISIFKISSFLYVQPWKSLIIYNFHNWRKRRKKIIVNNSRNISILKMKNIWLMWKKHDKESVKSIRICKVTLSFVSFFFLLKLNKTHFKGNKFSLQNFKPFSFLLQYVINKVD